MNDLHAADAILVATHSQGSIVSTHLLERLIREKHIKTSRRSDLLATASAALAPGGSVSAMPPTQRVCCLALCGIHLGPLRSLGSSSLVWPYLQVGVSDSLYCMGVFFYWKAFSFTSISSRRQPESYLNSRSVAQQTIYGVMPSYLPFIDIHHFTRGRARTVRLRKFT
jgi:hypothetical protein